MRRFASRLTRRQRRSDGTISIEGKRFEIPARFRDFVDVTIRYARWDLGRVDLIDPQGETILAPIYPLDRQANADGRRAVIEPASRHDDAQDQPSDARRTSTAAEEDPTGVFRPWNAADLSAQAI